MSILINGVSMPKDGLAVNISIFEDGSVRVRYYGGSRVIGSAIELPPHGRLGDLDALIIDLMDRGVDGVQTDDLYEILQTIMDAPTIIPAEGGDADK